VVQFVVAAFFIMSTLVIRNQMRFMQTKDKGFAADQVMRLETPQKVRDKNFDLTRSVLLNIPGVQYVSKTTAVPGDAISDTSTITFKCREKEYRMVSVKISDDYFKTLSIGLTGGRLFDGRYADQNTRTAVINESAAKKLNIENPIGATISFPYCDSVAVQVIGIVKDFNVSGFERMIQPTVFTIGNKACMFQSGGGILVKLNGGQVKKSVAAIENAWKTIEPDTPIRYSFLDDNFQKLFAAHIRLQKIITFFALSAILISIMGLFALTAFLVSQRTKEIGIRKILGAGISDLGLLLSKDFIRLILVSVLIAMPLGWWAAKVWLQSFSYRVNISGWTFIAAGAIIIAIAAITISFQAIKAAIANPVKSLRTE
jgi:putative ABC transport system permease protein